MKKCIFPTKIPQFRRFVLQNFPFIEKDFDALTDYALICKVVEYLNKVISSQNGLIDDVELLSNNFNILKEYVENYFENLDVQDEINNKLEEMADNGTLQEIVSSYLNSKAVFAFDNVSSMKSATNLINGSFAETLGFYEVNDGGKALYKIREVTNEDIVDEMFIISMNDNRLIAELVVDSEVNSKQCGIKGDGITDETEKLNNFFDISKGFNKILNNGVYVISNTLFIKGRWEDKNPSPYNITFEQATIKYTGTEDRCSVVIYNHKRSVIDGLNISSDSNSNYVRILGVWYSEFNNFSCKNLKLDTDVDILGDRTISTPSIMYLTFKNLRIVTGKITFNRPSSYINCIIFNECIIGSANNDVCIDVYGTSGSFQNIVFQNTDLSYATNAILKINDVLNWQSVFNFYNCYLDSKIPLVYNNDQKGALINTFGLFSPHADVRLLSTKYADIVGQSNIGGKTSSINSIATEYINYVKNGDISSTNEISGGYSELFGVSSALWSKEYIDSPLNVNNKARKFTLLQQISNDSSSINISSINAPRTGLYTPYIRFKMISGTFNELDLHFKGYINKISRSDIVNGKEILLTGQPRVINENDSFVLYLLFNGVNGSDDIVFEVYEVGIILGNTYIPYPKLHKSAEI